MNRKDLRALSLVEPPRENLGLDPLAVEHLVHQLFIWKSFFVILTNYEKKLLLVKLLIKTNHKACMLGVP